MRQKKYYQSTSSTHIKTTYLQQMRYNTRSILQFSITPIRSLASFTLQRCRSDTTGFGLGDEYGAPTLVGWRAAVRAHAGYITASKSNI